MLSLAALGFASDAWALPVTEVSGTTQANERRYPIPTGDSINVDRSVQLILVRYQGQVFALSLVCPHQHAAVRWLDAAGRFECTKHHSKYDADGRYLSGRATRNLDRFPIRRDGASVLVNVSEVWQADDNPAQWAAAAVPAA